MKKEREARFKKIMSQGMRESLREDFKKKDDLYHGRNTRLNEM
jgi:hypothetical protein